MPFEIKLSRRTLVELPQRAMAFLRGVGTNPEVYAVLAEAGYDAESHAKGWALLLDISGYRLPPLKPRALTLAEATEQLERWDESGLRRIRAALTNNHPDQAAFVFQDLEPDQGYRVVLVVLQLLGRLKQLEQGRSDATREEDRAAMATLAKRGFTPEERARLEALVEVAKGGDGSGELSEKIQDSYQRRLLTLYGWYNDWAETARAVIRRRDLLIKLGLAKRRTKKDGAPPPDDEYEPADPE